MVKEQSLITFTSRTRKSSSLVAQPHYRCGSKLICKELRADDVYQSLLNVQKRRGAPYRAAKNKHIQLLHKDFAHWLFTFCRNLIHICDSLKSFISRVNRKCLHALCKNCMKEFIVSFLLVEKQTDGYIAIPSQ